MTRGLRKGVRYLTRILAAPFGRDASRQLPARVGRDMANFLFFGGMAFDCTKAMLWAEWRPRQQLGLVVFGVYFGCNLAVPLSAALVRLAGREALKAGALLALCAFSSGLLNWSLLNVIIGERALIPLVFHGMFGVQVGILLPLTLQARDILSKWHKTVESDQPSNSIIAFRSTFEQELRSMLPVTLGLGVASSIGVGIAMVILVVGKGGWMPTDPDFNATMIQFFAGLAISLVCIFRWGVHEILRAQALMRLTVEDILNSNPAPAHIGQRNRIGPMTKKILFLAANPTDTGRLRLDGEIRAVDEGLKRSNERSRFELVARFAVRVEDLRRGLLDIAPNIVHFAGHGEGADGILVEDDQGKARAIPGDALAGLFELCAEHVDCVILNACYSDVQAEAISKHVAYVIGMKAGISDAAAQEFAVGFYDALGAGRSIQEAYKFGCNAIALKGIAEHLTPVLKKKI